MIKLQYEPYTKILFTYKRTTVFIDLILLPVVLLVVCFNMIQPFIIAVVSIYLHEIVHMLVAILKGCRIYGMGILPVGFNACIDDTELRHIDKAFIYLSGPCMNLIIAALLSTVFGTLPLTPDIVKTNLGLAVFNLIPIEPLDGGKCLILLVGHYKGLYYAKRILVLVTKVIASLFILLGILLCIKSLFFMYFAIVGLFLLLGSKSSLKEIASMNIRNIIYRRSRFLKRGIYSARQLVVTKSLLLSDAVRAMDYTDMFHIVNVLDEDLKIVKTFTEQEVIDELISGTGDLTFGDMIKNKVENENKM